MHQTFVSSNIMSSGDIFCEVIVQTGSWFHSCHVPQLTRADGLAHQHVGNVKTSFHFFFFYMVNRHLDLPECMKVYALAAAETLSHSTHSNCCHHFLSTIVFIASTETARVN